MPDIPRDTPLRPIKTAAIVGAGTMGGGIAMSFAEFGFPVKLLEASQEALDRGIARIRSNYETSVRRGSLTEAEMNRRMELIEPVTSYDDIGQCDVVIEAVFERIPVKEEVFKKLDEVMKPGALLYTNTSGIDIDIMANATKRPQDVAGTHFFAPANVMKLFEVVKGAKSAPDTLATGMDLGRKIGKISAMAGNGDGFVANRSRTPFGTEMIIMLEEGALPEQVDKVMVDFGYPIGPFATADLSGLDIGYDSRQRRAAQNPNYRKLPIADTIVEAGRFGQKTGAGWFRYEKGDRTPHPDPEVARIIKEKAAETRHRAAQLYRRGDPAPPAFRLGQRGLQDPRGGQGLPRQRHRRDVAGRLQLPALPRRPDVLGRHDRRRRGLSPDPGLAPAIRRALGPRRPAAPSRRNRHLVARGQARPADVNFAALLGR